MNIRTVRKKIKSIKNVKKITKAMQMVSAVKMRKAQQLEIEGRPYRDGLTEMITTLSDKIDPSFSKLLQVDTSNAKRELLVVVSSNKGLAGSFNVNLFRYLLSEYPSFKQVDIVTVGSKGTQFFSRLKDTTIIADYSRGSLLLEASALFDYLVEQYSTGKYKSVSIAYNQFVSTLQSEQVKKTLLPLSILETVSDSNAKNKQSTQGATLIIEPSAAEILEELLKSFLEYTIRGAIISSEAVEHSMRMMAMKSATDNAVEIIYQMTLLANRLRQEKITNELLDMITAKESVEGN